MSRCAEKRTAPVVMNFARSVFPHRITGLPFLIFRRWQDGCQRTFANDRPSICMAHRIAARSFFLLAAGIPHNRPRFSYDSKGKRRTRRVFSVDGDESFR